jgi:hypothetical protein
MSSKEAREDWRRHRTHIVMLFCKNFDMSVLALNNGYQLRIENLVDVYPTNGRYCILQSGERGGWDTAQDLRRIMLKALPNPSQDLKDNFVGANSVKLIADEYPKLKSPTPILDYLWKFLNLFNRRRK